MMTIPSLPTDNLYKFIALSGLVLMLFSATYPVHQVFELRERKAQTDEEVEVLRIEVTALMEKVARLEKEVDAFDKETKEARETDRDKDLVKSRAAEFRARSAEIRQANLELEMRSARLAVKHRLLSDIATNVLIVIVVLGVFGTAGLFMASWGFRAWYFRVQRLQDLLLNKQLTDLRRVDAGQ
jgi:hypothetical protein